MDDAAKIAAKLTPYRLNVLIRACDGSVVNGQRRRDPTLTRATNDLSELRLITWTKDGYRATKLGLAVRALAKADKP